MTILLARVARTRWLLQDVPRARSLRQPPSYLRKSMTFSTCCPLRQAEKEKKTDGDPRINDLGRAIEDDFATIRENYGT